jgi:hypothetical protein
LWLLRVVFVLDFWVSIFRSDDDGHTLNELRVVADPTPELADFDIFLARSVN